MPSEVTSSEKQKKPKEIQAGLKKNAGGRAKSLNSQIAETKPEKTSVLIYTSFYGARAAGVPENP